MTTSEKAKAYDEAIEKLRDFYRDYDTVSCLIDVKEELANLFPALKESEDEKIRKFLIKWIQDNYYHGTTEIPTKTLIAWLEKQKTIDVLDKEEREFADNVDSYRKDMDEFYKKGYDAGREAEKQYWFEKQAEQKPTIEMKSAEESLGIDSETYNKIVDECIYGDDKQNSAWSEEDEDLFNDVIAFLEDARDCRQNALDCIDWLKSLKQRIGG